MRALEKLATNSSYVPAQKCQTLVRRQGRDPYLKFLLIEANVIKLKNLVIYLGERGSHELISSGEHENGVKSYRTKFG
jgi:hypothetical protein